jgi:hypothetical protein
MRGGRSAAAKPSEQRVSLQSRKIACTLPEDMATDFEAMLDAHAMRTSQLMRTLIRLGLEKLKPVPDTIFGAAWREGYARGFAIMREHLSTALSDAWKNAQRDFEPEIGSQVDSTRKDP